MSHFTNIKTSFQNFSYLEKALDRLNISHKPSQTAFTDPNLYSTNKDITIVIPQSNGYDITFAWNGKEYDMVADMSFWEQPYPIETFVDKIAQEYAGEVVVGESQKIGFQPISYKKNNDGSNTIVIERWNSNKETYL